MPDEFTSALADLDEVRDLLVYYELHKYASTEEKLELITLISKMRLIADDLIETKQDANEVQTAQPHLGAHSIKRLGQ